MLYPSNTIRIRIMDQLNLADLESRAVDSVLTVVDLRFDAPFKARPLAEQVKRRLDNLHITYRQNPLDLFDEYTAEQGLLPILANRQGELIVVSDQVACVAAFCAAWRIRCSVENVEALVPAAASARKHLLAA